MERAAAWLELFLNGFAWPSNEIVDAGKQAGFTFDNIKEAKLALKAKGLQNSKSGRLHGEWWSGFGDPREWSLRPESTASHTETTPLDNKNTTPFFPPFLLSSYPQSDLGKEGKEGYVGVEGSKNCLPRPRYPRGHKKDVP